MSALIIADKEISRNKDGLYRLNDLHKVAGGESKHSPKEWVRSQQTKDLAQELTTAQNPALETVNGGNKRGTYACKELVYAYAMWISPAFHVKVIRAFDALASGDIEKAANLSGSKRALTALDDMRKAKAIDMQIANAKAIYELLPHLGESSRQVIAASLVNPVAGADIIPLPRIEQKFYTTTEIAKELEITTVKLGKLANSYDMRKPENGEYRLSKSQYSSKQVEQWFWSESGRKAMRELIDALRD